MPYIITTQDHPTTDPHEHDDACFTSRAVATLDEANDYAGDVVARALNFVNVSSVELPESGGTIGPLPDGTVIEVSAVDWRSMLPVAAERWPSLWFATNPTPWERDRILAAFNSR